MPSLWNYERKQGHVLAEGGIFSGEFSRAKFTKLFDTKEFPPRMTRWDPIWGSGDLRSKFLFC
jgi:hypothetical protein